MAGNIEILGNNRYRFRVSIGSGKNRKVFKQNYKSETPMKDDKIPREVELALAKFVAAVDENKVSKSNITFKQFVDVWKNDYAERTLKVKTITRYNQMLDDRIIPAIGHIRISRLSPSHLNNLYSQMVESGSLSKRTIRHHHSLISSILGKATKWDYIISNVAEKADPPQPEEKEMPFLDEALIREIMKLLGKEKLKYRAMVMLDIFSGLRRGELVGLEWPNIDFDNNCIKVEKTLNYTANKGIYEDTVKTKKSNRTIIMPKFVMQLLWAYKTEQQLYKNKKRKKDKLVEDNDKLFIQHNGKPMHPDTPTKWWPKFLKKNNLPHVNFHGLRHTQATLIISMNFDVASGASRMGHARNETFLNKYTHALESKDQAIAKSFDKAFGDTQETKIKRYKLRRI